MNKCPNCGAETSEEVCMLCGTQIPKEVIIKEEVKEDPVRISVIPLDNNEAVVTESVNKVETPIQPVQPNTSNEIKVTN